MSTRRPNRRRGRGRSRRPAPTRWPRARLTDERASLQVRCPHPGCDACALIHLDYGEQLRIKGEAVALAFSPYPTLRKAKRRAPIAAPSPAGYRTRVKLLVSQAGNQVRAGLYRRGTRDLQPIPECPITSAEVRDLAARVCTVLEREGGASPEGPIRGMDIRHGDGDAPMSLTLILDRDDPSADDLPVAALFEACPDLQMVAVNPHPGRSPLALGPRTDVVQGDTRTEVQLGGQRMWLSPGVFFQVNAAQTETIHHLLREFFGREGGRLLDLYCGAGTHALSLASRFDHVLGIEVVGDAIEDARETASRRRLEHVEFEAADVRHGVPTRLAEGWDAVVVNPPRGGCPPELRDALAAAPPRRVAYVSCNPVTLARDLHHLVRRGFVVRLVTPVDMMPCTDQVECVALLEPQPGARDHGPHPWTKAIGEDGSYVVIALLVDSLPGTGEVPADDLTRAGVEGVVRYRCLTEVGGHSLVRLEVDGVEPAALRRALRYFRHPVVGDLTSGVRSVNHFFAERFGLDRAFFQIAGPSGQRRRRSQSLEPDLQAVLEQARRRSR